MTHECNMPVTSMCHISVHLCQMYYCNFRTEHACQDQVCVCSIWCMQAAFMQYLQSSCFIYALIVAETGCHPRLSCHNGQSWGLHKSTCTGSACRSAIGKARVCISSVGTAAAHHTSYIALMWVSAFALRKLIFTATVVWVRPSAKLTPSRRLAVLGCDMMYEMDQGPAESIKSSFASFLQCLMIFCILTSVQ